MSRHCHRSDWRTQKPAAACSRRRAASRCGRWQERSCEPQISTPAVSPPQPLLTIALLSSPESAAPNHALSRAILMTRRASRQAHQSLRRMGHPSPAPSAHCWIFHPNTRAAQFASASMMLFANVMVAAPRRTWRDGACSAACVG